MPRGITFSETMAGPFALDEQDPERGRATGARRGTRLTMNARVSIADLDAFVADPDHAGELAGSVDFAPLGVALTAHDGVFNLFSPSGQPELKLMVYELAISAAGKPYYVAGRKEVRDDRGFDLWSDTTTLYTTLHQGAGKDGPVVGAGILGLGVRDLGDLLATVRVTGAGSPLEIAETLTKFGVFFMGELWHSYGPEMLKSFTGRGRR